MNEKKSKGNEERSEKEPTSDEASVDESGESPEKPTTNSFNRMEWAGAFGDLGTLIPFVIGYIAIVDIDPLGILLTFGVFLIASGLVYKTPFPVQPMKAIGGAAITQASLITSNMVWAAGLFTGVFWLIIGLTGAMKYIANIVSKPVLRGIVLGLGISFIIQALTMMRTDIIITVIALILTIVLFSNKRVPAMFVLLLLGVVVTFITSPGLLQEIIAVRPGFRLPGFALSTLSWRDFLTGIFILALPQIPLTLGNSAIATAEENNRRFPDRPVRENKVAATMGIMNIISPVFGGVPVCHGAGGMASHVRFGAKTGGAVIILGSFLLLLGLFFSDSVVLILEMIPVSVLGVMLFFAGIELAMSARDVGSDKTDFYILLFSAGFSIWNVGIGFLAGLIMQFLVKRKWFKG